MVKRKKALKSIDEKIIKIMNKMINIAEEVYIMKDEVDKKSDIITSYDIRDIYDSINEVHTYFMRMYGLID